MNIFFKLKLVLSLVCWQILEVFRSLEGSGCYRLFALFHISRVEGLFHEALSFSGMNRNKNNEIFLRNERRNQYSFAALIFCLVVLRLSCGFYSKLYYLAFSY